MAKNFTAPIDTIEHGGKRYVVFIPGDVVEELEIKGVMRMIGTANGAAFRLAALSDGHGRYFLQMEQILRREAGVKPGEQVKITVAIDPNPDFIDVPEELEIALDQDPEATEHWNGYTPGFKRSIVHYVTSAKREETRIKRSLELCDKMKNNGFYNQRMKK